METFGLVDREGWAPGPWDGEPDEVTFRASVGLACAAVRSPELGCWRGYVEVPRDHPWFGVDERALPDIPMHGGLTFAGTRGEGWWIGFDCGHYDDVMPGLDALLVRFGERAHTEIAGTFGTYKTLAYVRAECARVALLVMLARTRSDPTP